MPAERKLVSAVIYNRLHARMPLGIDATLRYGLHIPPTQSILESQLQSDNPYNTRKTTGLPPTPITNPGLASIQAAAHPAHVELPLLRAQARQDPPVLHRERDRVRAVRVRSRVRLLNNVALLGHPVAHSLSPRMQNAAFAACGLDWHYTAFDVADRRRRGRGSRHARLRRRERDDPAQAGRRRGVRRGRRRRGQHASSFATGASSASTPTARSWPGSTPTRACLIGAGGAARALDARAARRTRASSPARATWPPDATDCDLVVNATPGARPSCSSQPRPGQTSSTSPTATTRPRSSPRHARRAAR